MARVRTWNCVAPALHIPSWRALARIPPGAWASGLAIVAVVVLHFTVTSGPSRGLAIRDALLAGAKTTQSLPATEPQKKVRAALAHDFRGFVTEIDATRFPAEVDVTFRNVAGVTCLEAETLARRLVGTVVVELEGYSSAAACGPTNSMTWRVMP